MQSVISKPDLLKILEKNLQNHRTIFFEAVDGYKEKAQTKLLEHLEQIKSGKLVHVRVYLEAPQDHTRDYTRIIKMVKATNEVNIRLTEQDFQYYVEDDWDWKRQFLISSSDYSSTAAKILKDEDDS